MLTYLFIAKDALRYKNKEELVVVEKVFQNVNSTIPHIEGIIFLKRGEAYRKIQLLIEKLKIYLIVSLTLNL